jgi:hypothetical protein
MAQSHPTHVLKNRTQSPGPVTELAKIRGKGTKIFQIKFKIRQFIQFSNNALKIKVILE